MLGHTRKLVKMKEKLSVAFMFYAQHFFSCLGPYSMFTYKNYIIAIIFAVKKSKENLVEIFMLFFKGTFENLKSYQNYINHFI